MSWRGARAVCERLRTATLSDARARCGHRALCRRRRQAPRSCRCATFSEDERERCEADAREQAERRPDGRACARRLRAHAPTDGTCARRRGQRRAPASAATPSGSSGRRVCSGGRPRGRSSSSAPRGTRPRRRRDRPRAELDARGSCAIAAARLRRQHACDRERGWGDTQLPAARARMGSAARSSRQPTAGVPRDAPMWGARMFIGGSLLSDPTGARERDTCDASAAADSSASAAAARARAGRPCGTSPSTNRARGRTRRNSSPASWLASTSRWSCESSVRASHDAAQLVAQASPAARRRRARRRSRPPPPSHAASGSAPAERRLDRAAPAQRAAAIVDAREEALLERVGDVGAARRTPPALWRASTARASPGCSSPRGPRGAAGGGGRASSSSRRERATSATASAGSSQPSARLRALAAPR